MVGEGCRLGGREKFLVIAEHHACTVTEPYGEIFSVVKGGDKSASGVFVAIGIDSDCCVRDTFCFRILPDVIPEIFRLLPMCVIIVEPADSQCLVHSPRLTVIFKIFSDFTDCLLAFRFCLAGKQPDANLHLFAIQLGFVYGIRHNAIQVISRTRIASRSRVRLLRRDDTVKYRFS